MFELSLRFDHHSFYAALTETNPVTIDLWCHNHCDLLYVTGEQGEQLLERLEDTLGIQHVIVGENELLVLTDNCLLEHEEHLLEEYLARHNCLSLEPWTYTEGSIITRIIATTEDDLKAIYDDLRQYFQLSVDSKRELRDGRPGTPLVVVDSAFPTLSARQREAIEIAYELGYYDIPRGCRTADIADELGIGRRTAEEHLRLAERKIVDGFMNVINRHRPPAASE